MGRSNNKTGKPAKLTPKEIRIQQRADADRAAREGREQAQMAERQAKADSDREKEARVAAASADFVNKCRVEWNAQIDPVVVQVLALRAANPGANGINAGENDAGNTPGGTDNPIVLGWPRGAPGKLSKGDALKQLVGFDNSDSGFYKVKRRGVLVHLK